MKEYDNEIVTEVPEVTPQPKFSPPSKVIRDSSRLLRVVVEEDDVQ